MNQRIYLFAGAVALAISAGAAYVGTAKAATSNLTVDAVIVEAITLDCTGQALDFGNLDASVASVITISTAGARSATVPASLVGGGSPDNGECSLDGEDGLAVDIDIPDTTITDGTDTLTVDNYTFAGAGAATVDPNNHTVTLQVGGAQTYSIGGDLTLVGGEGAGTYSGTISVNAAYQ